MIMMSDRLYIFSFPQIFSECFEIYLHYSDSLYIEVQCIMFPIGNGVHIYRTNGLCTRTQKRICIHYGVREEVFIVSQKKIQVHKKLSMEIPRCEYLVVLCDFF